MARVAAVMGLVLCGITWQLWIPISDYPQVPLVRGLENVPQSADFVLCAVLVAGLLATLAAPRRPWGACLVAVGMVGLVALNQHRLQPWLYHLALVVWLIGWSGEAKSGRLLRYLTASIYVYSACSKVDASFMVFHGRALVDAMLVPVDLSSLPRSVQVGLTASLPAAELLIGLGLLWPRTRRWACWASYVMHLALCVALGPWGLNHRPPVLAWNLFFIVQNAVIFADQVPPPTASAPARWRLSLAASACSAAVVLPATSLWGFYDEWPSWSLYSARAASLNVWTSCESPGVDSELERFLEEHPLGTRCRLRIDRWSLDALGVPIYPSNRFRIGVVRALVENKRLTRRAAIEIEDAADRMTGWRVRTIIGYEELLTRADEYRCNSRPRRQP